MSVYLSVCLFVCPLVELENCRIELQLFLHVAPAVARSSSDGDAIRYVLSVLQMTLCFHTMGPMGRIKHDVMFRRVHQVAVPIGRQTTAVFG